MAEVDQESNGATATAMPGTRRRLPRGRHDLSREQVEADQRLRILLGFCSAMAEGGYADTPVAAVIKHAGVSRDTYYRLFADKLDGFLAAFDLVSGVLVAELRDAIDGPGSPLERVEQGLAKYLAMLSDHRGEARLFLVEAFAAGPAAIERRMAVQQTIADEIVAVFDSRGEAAVPTARMVVAAVASMISAALIDDHHDAVAALLPELSAQLRRLHAAGLFD